LNVSTQYREKELKKLPKDWTGELVGLMHCNHITGLQLAEKLGVTNRYVSMVLNGHRDPQGAEARFREAVTEIIEERKENAHGKQFCPGDL